MLSKKAKRNKAKLAYGYDADAATQADPHKEAEDAIERMEIAHDEKIMKLENMDAAWKKLIAARKRLAQDSPERAKLDAQIEKSELELEALEKSIDKHQKDLNAEKAALKQQKSASLPKKADNMSSLKDLKIELAEYVDDSKQATKEIEECEAALASRALEREQIKAQDPKKLEAFDKATKEVELNKKLARISLSIANKEIEEIKTKMSLLKAPTERSSSMSKNKNKAKEVVAFLRDRGFSDAAIKAKVASVLKKADDTIKTDALDAFDALRDRRDGGEAALKGKSDDELMQMVTKDPAMKFVPKKQGSKKQAMSPLSQAFEALKSKVEELQRKRSEGQSDLQGKSDNELMQMAVNGPAAPKVEGSKKMPSQASRKKAAIEPGSVQALEAALDKLQSAREDLEHARGPLMTKVNDIDVLLKQNKKDMAAAQRELAEAVAKKQGSAAGATTAQQVLTKFVASHSADDLERYEQVIQEHKQALEVMQEFAKRQTTKLTELNQKVKEMEDKAHGASADKQDDLVRQLVTLQEEQEWTIKNIRENERDMQDEQDDLNKAVAGLQKAKQKAEQDEQDEQDDEED